MRYSLAWGMGHGAWGMGLPPVPHKPAICCIWRGHILGVVRDREKKGGEGRGTGFLNWLKEREISKSKSQAYSLCELMDGNLRLW